MVTAPAGYGKTTSVAQYLTSRDIPFIWYSARDRDQDPVLFLAHLVTAVTRLDPGAGSWPVFTGLLPLESHESRLAVIRAIISDLGRIGDGRGPYVILDDIHTLGSGESARLLEALCDDIPAGVRLCLMGCSPPPTLPAGPESAEILPRIGETDLQFSVEETVQWLESSGHSPGETAPGLAAHLVSATGGWAAALSLALQALPAPDGATGLTPDDLPRIPGGDGVYKHLAEGAFSALSSRVQGFLLSTAVLEDLTPRACSALSGMAEAECEYILESLVSRGGFTLATGRSPLTYRYHRLFRDFLLGRLAHERPNQVRELMRAAGEHHLSHGNTVDGLPYFLQAGDWDRAVPVFEGACSYLVESGQVTSLRLWLAMLPAERVKSSSTLQACMGRAAEVSGQMDEGIAAYELASRLYGQEGRSAEALLSRARAARLMAFGGRVDEALDWASGAWSEAVAMDDDEGAQVRAEIGAVMARASWIKGDTGDAVEWIRRSLDDYRRAGDRAGMSAMVNNLAVALYEPEGNLARALECHRESHRLDMETGRLPGALVSLANMGHVSIRMGQLDRARRYLDQAMELAERIGYRYGMGLVHHFMGILNLDRGDLAGADRHLRQALVLFEDLDDRWREAGSSLTLSRVMLERADRQEARRLAEKDLSLVREMGNPVFLAESLANLALIAGGDEGAGHLDEALSLVPDYARSIHITLRLVQAILVYEHGNEAVLDEAEACLTDARRAGYLEALRQYVPHRPRLFLDLYQRGREAQSVQALFQLLASTPRRWSALLELLGPGGCECAEAVLSGASLPETTHGPIDLSVRLLGGFEISVRGRPLSGSIWRSAPARNLLCYLLISGEGRISRDQLVSKLWPDMERRRALNNFRVTLHRLREVLRSQELEGIVSYDAGACAFIPPDSYWCDRDMFLAAVREAQRSTEAGDADGAHRGLGRAVSAYGGELLPGIYEDWAVRERARLEDAYLNCLEELAVLRAAAGAYHEAARLCRRMLGMEPFREQTHRLLMACLYLGGEADEALRQYEECRRVLGDDLGIPPSPQTVAVLKAVAEGRPLTIDSSGQVVVT